MAVAIHVSELKGADRITQTKCEQRSSGVYECAVTIALQDFTQRGTIRGDEIDATIFIHVADSKSGGLVQEAVSLDVLALGKCTVLMVQEDVITENASRIHGDKVRVTVPVQVNGGDSGDPRRKAR